MRYEYDALSRRRRREIGPAGSAKVTQYHYEADGAFSAVDHEGHKVLIQRDRLGREVRRHVYAGQVDIESRYDAMDQLAEQRVSKPGNGVLEVLAQRRWRYDLNGRVTQIEDQRWGTTSYTYDKLGQLKEARTGSRVEVFDYDPNGSLERILTELGGSRMRWDVGGGNRLRSTDTARYEDDERGRRTRKVEYGKGGNPGPDRVRPGNLVTDYAWDSRDRLREVLLPDGRKARYQYDAFGRRVRKEIVPAERGDFAAMLVLATKDGVDALPKIERTTFIWDGDVICQELKSPNAGGVDGVKTYVHEPGTFVPMLHEEQGAVFTYVVDHLGTPRELIDRDGRVAWAGSFSAWGKEAEDYRDPKCRWRVEVPWRLLGQYADAETGLCSTRFRYFDAEAGRWLSPDPLGLAGGKNLHAFDGAPSVEVDPWGLATGCVKGGTYAKVRAANEGGEVHHLPTKAALKAAGHPMGAGAMAPHGPAIWMETKDHRIFPSTRNNSTLAVQQALLIKQNNFDDAFLLGVAEIQQFHGSKYDDAILQAIDSLP